MKLNIGSSTPRGMYKHDAEWINLDLFSNRNINVVGSGFALPFKDNCIERIHCVHVLEHVTRDKQLPMLAEMQRVLIPGGKALVEVPDLIETARELLRRWEQGNIEGTRLMTVSLFGKSERPGMAHYWGYTNQYLMNQFAQVGFSKFRELVKKENMISQHYTKTPVLLIEGTK